MKRTTLSAFFACTAWIFATFLIQNEVVDYGNPLGIREFPECAASSRAVAGDWGKGYIAGEISCL